MPLRWVVRDVLAEACKPRIISDHVIVETALPEGGPGGTSGLIDDLRRHALEAANNSGQRFGPLRQLKNAMKVIGHNDELVECQIRELIGQTLPSVANDLAKICENYRGIDHLSQDAPPPSGADGHE